MPQLTASGIGAVTTGFRRLFSQGQNAAKPKYGAFVVLHSSTGSSTKMIIGGGLPGLRQWVGARDIKRLANFIHELPNDRYELTIAVDRDAFEDDEIGMYSDQVKTLGMQASLDPDKRLATLLTSGFTSVCYDGQPFFSTAHPILATGATQSNKGTAALDAAAFEAGMAALRQLKNAQGEPVDPFDYGAKATLVVPPQLEATGKGIVGVRTLSAGGDNPNYQAAELLVDGRLAGHPTKWFILLGGQDSMLKPFIRSTRRAPKLVALTNPDDPNVFFSNELIWGVDYRGKVGLGAYHAAYGSDGTT